MNDEVKKEGERLVASEGLEKFLGDVDFGKYNSPEGKLYFEGVLLWHFPDCEAYSQSSNCS